MTVIYFIRHAQPDYAAGGDRDRPLTEKGRHDRERVTEYLRDKNISAVLSSPFVRAVETVKGFADSAGLPVVTVEDFRERKISDTWIDDFKTYAEKQWTDFTYALPDGECLAEVQARNVSALKDTLAEYEGKNLAVGTHGTALSLIINHYDASYGIDEFWAMAGKMPYAVKMVFDGQDCVSIEPAELNVSSTKSNRL